MFERLRWNMAYRLGSNRWTGNVDTVTYWLHKLNPTPGRALDLGCGAGEKSWLLSCSGFSTIGLDISDVAIRQAEAQFPSLDYRVFDLNQLEKFTEDSFDLIIDLKVLPFIKDKEKYLSEVRKRLSGIYILEVPVVHRRPIFIPEKELRLLLKDFEILGEHRKKNTKGEVISFTLK